MDAVEHSLDPDPTTLAGESVGDAHRAQQGEVQCAFQKSYSYVGTMALKACTRRGTAPRQCVHAHIIVHVIRGREEESWTGCLATSTRNFPPLCFKDLVDHPMNDEMGTELCWWQLLAGCRDQRYLPS